MSLDAAYGGPAGAGAPSPRFRGIYREPAPAVAVTEVAPATAPATSAIAPATRTDLPLNSYTNDEILRLWMDTVEFAERDRIVADLQRRKLYPASYVKQWENDTGAYPTHDDPEFLQKLLAKREFAESLQSTWRPATDPCSDTTTFEVTPVQRFAANLMSPRSPYMSALLFHGVGVGKTCAGVQIMEAWLNTYPREKVYLVAPPTIQGGFYRTIFDINAVKISPEEGVPNTAIGCVGSTYMDLTGTLLEKNKERIERQVGRAIRRRYAVFGYRSFANYIKKLLAPAEKIADEEQREIVEARIINREFSGRLVVVDEAHNLRDVEGDIYDTTGTGTGAGTGVGAGAGAPGGKADEEDAKDGKLLTPYLRKVLRHAEGLKLVMMTATPMYNSHREIVFMMNLINLNEKKALVKPAQIFNNATGKLTDQGRRYIGYFASRYISFMRGENPRSFPLRLFPELGSGGELGAAADEQYLQKLPIVPIELKGESLAGTLSLMRELGNRAFTPFGLTVIVQAGNCVVPAIAPAAAGADGAAESSEENSDNSSSEDGESYRSRIGAAGIKLHFTDAVRDSELIYTPRKADGARWLGVDQLGNYAPKLEFFVRRAKTCKGVMFAYSRFIEGGALPLALALEANGYKPWNRKRPMLGYQTPGGGQCALCPRRETGHAGADPPFAQAYYGLLTGNQRLSPAQRNQDTIKAERAIDNKDGRRMKIIIGSQIASEGVDLRFVRETHLIDSWFHLNKTEQIIGRSIRFCSHSALPEAERNVTVYLYAAALPTGSAVGTATSRITGDLYSYKLAYEKARLVGDVTRTIKIHSIDCNLNHDAIVIAGQDPVNQVDSQGLARRVSINDMPYTAICDWLETCDYECVPKIRVNIASADDSTYSEYAARWREAKLRERLRSIFKEQLFVDPGTMTDLFNDVPAPVRTELLLKTVNNRLFEVEHQPRSDHSIKGYIIYCNGYYVFQPSAYVDIHIPLSVRAAKFPVRRDEFDPAKFRIEEAPEVIPVIADGAAGAGAADADAGAAAGAGAGAGAAAAGAGAGADAGPGAEAVWRALEGWVNAMTRTTSPLDIPEIVVEHLGSVVGSDVGSRKAINEMLEAFKWMQYSYVTSARRLMKDIQEKEEGGRVEGIVREIAPEYLVPFHQAVLSFAWTHWFTYAQQKELASIVSEPLARIMSSMTYSARDTIVRQFFNPGTGKVEYICDGKVCAPALVAAAKAADASRNPLANIKINSNTTAPTYGFITTHDGNAVFKTSNPPPVDGKVAKGSMCSNVSNMSGKYEIMTAIGKELEKAGEPHMALQPTVFVKGGERPVTNAVRACTIMELVLRYMDLRKVEDKRWFYNGSEAAVGGHVGAFKRN